LEAGHRVSLPTPCEEVSDLIAMAPGSQEATFLSEDEHEEGESSMESRDKTGWVQPMVDEPKSAQEVWKDPVSSIHMKKPVV
jgi:hypothetical protein